MKQEFKKAITMTKGWLLFFYSVPSKPVSSRVKIWRKLAKAGAVQVKGAVYMLPMAEEHHEFFQWLVSEVSAMGGEAAFTRVEGIESMKNKEVINLFTTRKTEEYQPVGKALEDIETRMDSIRKGSRSHGIKVFSEQVRKISRTFEDIRRTDFFGSDAGISIGIRITDLKNSIAGLAGIVPAKTPGVARKRTENYQGKIWVSRKRPFVDRMASAWLIRRFMDKRASFRFMDEKDLTSIGEGHVTFDVRGGEFTHIGDLCTFEILARSFGIKDRTVKKISEIVHELDIKDDKYRTSEAAGLQEILSGIRKSEKDDNSLLEKGISIFEMLYVSKAG